MPTFAYETSIGPLRITEREGFITHVSFGSDTPPAAEECRETELIRQAHRQLGAYLAGELKEFTLPLAPEGTEFMKRVWKSLQGIPYGETATYGELALHIGNPKAARAVGNANNKNPIPIIIPCHRVIGASGKLVGYRGGLALKATLLQLEKGKTDGVF